MTEIQENIKTRLVWQVGFTRHEDGVINIRKGFDNEHVETCARSSDIKQIQIIMFVPLMGQFGV